MAYAKKINAGDVKDLYKKLYSIKFDWPNILPHDVYDYMSTLAVANCCPLELQISALLPLFGMACGPNTHISTTRVDSPSNIYMIGICDPGGGKSAVCHHIMQPCFNLLSDIEYIGTSPHIEVYTTAGLQEHQQRAKGYGIIASAEGNRVIQSINNKVKKDEGERGLLCKL